MGINKDARYKPPHMCRKLPGTIKQYLKKKDPDESVAHLDEDGNWVWN